MPGIVLFQTNFSTGELDPLLRSRTDLEQYQNALESAKNVVVQPQGGVRRRPGLKFLHHFTSNPPFRLIPFEYSVEDSYMLALGSGRIYVFKDRVLQTNINGSGNDYITATAINAVTGSELSYTQAVDTLIFTHKDMSPKRLVRNSDTNWTFEDLPISNIPQYAFYLDTHNPQFTITPSEVTGNITITASAVTSDNGTAQAGSSDTITLKAATSMTSDDQPNGMFIEITSGTGVGQTRHIEDYVASTKVATVYPAWDTAPDATSGYDIKAYKPAAVGEYLNVANGFGRARYTEYVSNTEMKAYVEIPFFDTDPIVAGDWESEHGYEDTWSTTRGWPSVAAFHESRLYFAGTSSRPNTIWGSRVIDYFNFDPGTALDDEAVEATINSERLNVITHLVSGPDLTIFTTGGEYVVSVGNEPITPSNFLVKRQTALGAKQFVPIVNLDGASIYIQRQGKSLISYQYRDSTASYGTVPLSVLSSHLLKDPSDLAIRQASSTDETDRIYIVNDNDGSMAVYSILTSQNVIAPSRFVTGEQHYGKFKNVSVDIDDVYVIVQRDIDGGTRTFVEVFDDDITTDSAKIGGAASSITMDHLEDEEVQVIRDGIVEEAQTVPASPYTITFASPATSSYEVGLNYEVEIKTMPAEPRIQGMSVQSMKKRIVQVDALVYETQNMKVNDQLVSFRNFGVSVLDSPVQEFTGTKTIHSLLGYSDTGQITVTQSVPLKLTLLGMEYKMSVGA